MALPERRWHNVGVVRERDTDRTRRFALLLLAVVVAVSPFTVYLLQQMDYVKVLYKIEELRTQHGRLVEMEQRLRVERASLVTPSRVEERAVEDLGLVHPSPEQVVVVSGPQAGRGGQGLMARAPRRR
jgi:cell division protein FtsL